jgi:hypothetical protein
MAKKRSIYEIRITLEGSKPPIWRKLAVPLGYRRGRECTSGVHFMQRQESCRNVDCLTEQVSSSALDSRESYY